MTTDKIFIDTNILIYLVDEESPFHTKTREIFSGLSKSGELWISRQVIREYCVIVTRPDLIAIPLSSELLINDINKFENIFTIADETSRTTAHLTQLIDKYKICGKKIHDVNIVASMIENTITNLFTANISDFKKFNEIDLISLLDK